MRTACALIALLAVQVSSQDAPEELVRKALAKDVEDSAKVHSLTSEKKSKTEELDKNSKPKRVLSEDTDVDRIKSSIAKTFRAGRFVYRFVGLVDQNDRVTIAIHFEPGRRSSQPGPEITPEMDYTSREVEIGFTEVLNNLSGRLYLDRDTLGIARFEAHLTRDVSRKIVWVHQADTTYEQMLFEDVWVPKKVVTIARYDKYVWFNKHFEQKTITFENYQLRPPGD